MDLNYTTTSELRERFSPSEEAQSFVERFQFQLKINERIIIQRYFKINDFNEEALGSMDLKKAIDEIVGVENPITLPGQIKHDIKVKSRLYLWSSFDPQYYPDRIDPITNINERLGDEIVDKKTGIVSREKIPYQDYYEFIFLIDEIPVINKIFDANVYPVKIRKSVKINELVYSICNKLAYACSKAYIKKIGDVYDYQLAYYKNKPKELIYEERKKESKWLSKQNELANRYLDDCFGYVEKDVRKRK